MALRTLSLSWVISCVLFFDFFAFTEITSWINDRLVNGTIKTAVNFDFNGTQSALEQGACAANYQLVLWA